jgi:hypothetical protein
MAAPTKPRRGTSATAKIIATLPRSSRVNRRAARDAWSEIERENMVTAKMV